MPEAIVINKILLRDDTTCCMKPDLQVNLMAGAVEGVNKQNGETSYSALRRIFRQRLVDFFRDHPEGDDIPEHELPHPFNQRRSSVPQTAPRIVPESTSSIKSSDLGGQQSAVMSHMSQSFKKRFWQRSPISSITVGTISSVVTVGSIVPSQLSSNVSGAIEDHVLEEDGKVSVSMFGASEGTLTKFSSTPVMLMASTPDLKTSTRPISAIGYVTPPVSVSMFGASEGTPTNFSSTPVRLMASTPDLKTPTRPISAIGYVTPPLKMVKKSARTKLFATPTKDANSMHEEYQNSTVSAVDSDDELLSFLPQSLLQSVKQKEQRVLEEKETGSADRFKRQKLIASLPSIFDIVYLIYQSRQQSVMKKQELIHKIIASSPKIVDRSEVEERLRLLKQLVPDWISEKTARSGDLLCCVDATLSQSDIRQRLYAAE